MLGVSHDRWLLVHLHLAALGRLALLILAVGRTLGPMLAPAAQPRRHPLEELLLTPGLWLVLAGIAADITPPEAAVFGIGVRITAIGVYAGSGLATRAGACWVAAAAVLAAAAAAIVWQRRSRTEPATE
jgi:hypothetical protein